MVSLTLSILWCLAALAFYSFAAVASVVVAGFIMISLASWYEKQIL